MILYFVRNKWRVLFPFAILNIYAEVKQRGMGNEVFCGVAYVEVNERRMVNQMGFIFSVETVTSNLTS